MSHVPKGQLNWAIDVLRQLAGYIDGMGQDRVARRYEGFAAALGQDAHSDQVRRTCTEILETITAHHNGLLDSYVTKSDGSADIEETANYRRLLAGIRDFARRYRHRPGLSGLLNMFRR